MGQMSQKGESWGGNRGRRARAARIRQLFQQSPYFQSLCEDYREGPAYCRYWRQAVPEQAPVYGKSYTELLGELEQEIRQYLDQHEV